MSFTDEDLIQLEENLETRSLNLVSALAVLPRLLARLEAAEAYMASRPENVTDENCRLYKEWQKAAGK